MLPRQRSLISALFRGRGFRAGLATLVAGSAIATGALLSNLGGGPRVAVAPPMQLTTSGLPGYWLVASDGGIFPFGTARGLGSTGGTPLNRPIVGMTSTPDGGGYWLVASDGGIFPFGDAGGYGSTGGMHLNQPIVGMASTPSGHGYWLVASDGGIFPFGDAGGYGSTGGMTLNQPIVGMAAAPDAHGYWLVARDGGIFPFGSAPGLGSTGGMHLNQPIVGMAPAPNGRGYWLVASDGGIFPFGTAAGLGSTGGMHLNQPIVGMAASPVAVPLYSLIASSTDKVQADGVSTARITVGVVAAPFVGVADDPISFSVTPSGCGTVSPDARATDVKGLLTATYTAGTSVQDCSVRATEQLVGTSAATKITQTASQPASISGSPSTATSMTADQGATGIPVTFTVLDLGGHPVPGAVLDLSVSLPHGSVGPTTASSDSQGRVTAKVTDTVAGDSGAAIATVHGQGISGQTGNLTITPGVAHTLVFSAQPSTTKSTLPITPAVQVAVDDAHGNLVNSSAAGITVALGANPAAGTLSGTLTQAATNGVASFSNLSIDKVGTGYTLTAASSALAGATSGAFNIVVDPVTHLGFSMQPTSTQSAARITPSVTVQELDSGGNLVTTATDTVTMAIGTNPSAGTLGGTRGHAAVNGVATFSDLAIDKAGTGYTLAATSGALTGATSSPFDITVGPASQLSFSVQPTSTPSTSHITPSVSVQELDAGGNLVTTATDTVTMAIGTNPSAGTLGGTLTQAAANGVASFSNLSIDKAGTGYALAATSGALTGAASSPFDITVGPATHLAFSVQPTSTQSAAHITPSVSVQELDAGGNLVTTATDNVTIAIGTNPSAGTLNGTKTKAASAGVATFSDLAVDKAGIGYTLGATSGSLTAATSNPFDITPGAASKLVFTTQPAGASGGTAMTTQPVVTVEDAAGNTVTGDASAVSLAITPATNTAGGTLTCTTNPLNASAGIAAFSGCRIDKAANGYTLTATDGILSPATSSAFNVVVGPAAHLAFTTQPSSSTGGTAPATQPVVALSDAGGNPTPGDTSMVTLKITTGTGTTGAALSCTTNPLTATAGVAHFAGCKVDKAGTGYTLTATDGTLTPAVSNTFDITVGPAAQLGFSVQPSNAVAGTAISPAVVVEIDDAGGNLVNTATNGVSLAIGNNPSGGTLSGNTPQVASAGKATFSNLKIDKAGSGYTLVASGTGLNSGTSAAFPINSGVVTAISFTGGQPGNTTGGLPIPGVKVSEVDQFGNVVTTATDSIVVSIGTNPSSGTLSGTTTRSAVNGVAAFGDLSINKTGNGYKLQAVSGSFPAVNSAPFNVGNGVGAQLVFSTEPGPGTGGSALSTQPVVTVEDAGGNVATGDNSNVTLAITANTGTAGATLSCASNPTAASSGVATFAGCKIDKKGNGYTLTATDSTLVSAVSTAFNVTVGLPAQLAFTTPPSDGTGGTALATQPVVAVEDAGGNTVTTDGSQVTLAITANTGTSGAVLTCTTNPLNATAGVAQFAGCKIDKVGSAYKLTATDGSLTAATSPTFNITAGSPTKVVFTTQPGSGTGGTALSTQPVVTVEDAGGNTVPTDSSQVTLAINNNPSGGTLSCTPSTTKAAASGVAGFAGCRIDKSGNGYTLKATDGLLTLATSNPFNVTVGAAAQLAFTTQPVNGTGGTALPTQPVITVQDAGANTVTSDSSQVTLAITASTGTSGATLTCTTNPVTASSGVATFAGCKIDKTGNGYTLTATDGTLVSAVSSTFNITLGSPAKLAFVAQPTNTNVGATITPDVTVAIEDAGGNLETGATDSVTLTLNSTPAGATLSHPTVTAVSGVADFSMLSVNNPGKADTLTPNTTTLTGANSVAFNIYGAASQLAFSPTDEPTDTTMGQTMKPVKVLIEDSAGNLLTGTNNGVSLTLMQGTPNTGGTLSGTLTKAAVNGVVTFSDLSVDKVSTGYKLDAASTALIDAVSTPFNILP